MSLCVQTAFSCPLETWTKSWSPEAEGDADRTWFVFLSKLSEIKTGPGTQTDCFAYHTAEMLSPWHKEIAQINSFLYMSWISPGRRMLIWKCEHREKSCCELNRLEKKKCVCVSSVPSADMHVFLVVSLKLYKRQIWKQSVADCRHTGRRPTGCFGRASGKLSSSTGLYEMCFCSRPQGRSTTQAETDRID